jgi:hypothetical protein
MTYPTPVKRGCGERQQGGIYAECGMGPNGKPIEHFLLDPPIPLDQATLDRLGITAIGTQLIKSEDGTYHLYDWVGSNYYPNVADFVEEVRLFGLSRRLSPQLDYSKLTERSQIRLIHARAWLDNFADYAWNLCSIGKRCLKENPEHMQSDPPIMCSSVWWQDLELNNQTTQLPNNPRLVTRTMPSFDYVAARRPDGVEPKYVPALFAAFPIHRLAVVKGGKHDANKQKAACARIPTASVEE